VKTRLTTVVAKSLIKEWGETRAVDNVSFTVEEGRLAVLLGPSGCGKSTTLRMIAGLEEPTAGAIEIGGRDVSGLTGAARGVAMVFQSYALFPHLSVADNITFGLSVRKTPRDEIKKRLDEVAELLGLGQLLERKPSQLSGGQQQRVALGRALIAHASVCLLDEPLSNLDAQLRQELRREIRALQQRLGITMIYVTHDQTEAMSMADQVILMRGGHIEQNDVPSALYDWPATLFAARFIGGSSMNLVDLVEMPSGKGIGIKGQDTPLLPDAGGSTVVLGLRPEDVALDRGKGSLHVPGKGVPAIAGKVRSIEYLGADALVLCDIPGGQILARVRGTETPSPGADVRISWPRSAMHLFDGVGGQRLDPVDGSLHRKTEPTVKKQRGVSV
jgi:sn-glycerol 3-phosphate transport system ATP-binding protein